jgi:hypothetical protein
MELKRREFLECVLAAAAGVLCGAWRAICPGSATRRLAAAAPRAYPGPVVALDERKIRSLATWLG